MYGKTNNHVLFHQHHPDWDIGVAVIDSYTYYNLEFLENIDMSSTKTLKDLVRIPVQPINF